MYANYLLQFNWLCMYVCVALHTHNANMWLVIGESVLAYETTLI